MMLYPWTYTDVALWYAGLWFLGSFILWAGLMVASVVWQKLTFPKTN
jgi:hypothetical protein